MQLQLIYNASCRETANKDKTIIMSKEGSLTGSSLSSPIFIIECDYLPTNINYLYVPTFKAYYFITDITIVRNGLYKISANKDVLETAWDALSQTSAVIDRQQNLYNLYQGDEEFNIYSQPMIETRAFPTAFTDNQYILVTFGGQSTQEA